MGSQRQLTSGCSKPWVAQHVEREWWGNCLLQDQSKKLGPNSWWTSEHRKGRISLGLSTTSQCFYSTERKNCAFRVRTIRVRMLELCYKKAKEKAGGTTKSRVPTQTSYWQIWKTEETSSCFLAHTMRQCQVQYSNVSSAEAVGVQLLPGHSCQGSHTWDYFLGL